MFRAGAARSRRVPGRHAEAMDSGALKALELVLVLGAVLAWGFWELWSLRRDRQRREREERDGGRRED
jgi:hypothetical protein